MKFSALAFLGVVSATTITINDQTVQKIAGAWGKNADDLDKTLMGLLDQEQKELDPYFQSIMQTAQKM